MGTGSCSAIDVVHILRKSRQAVTGCVVEIEADRAAEDPKVFTRIRMRYIVTGKALARAQVERAIKLSKEKYCSATIMLAKSAAMEFDFEIREA
jgi:putative redox protein